MRELLRAERLFDMNRSIAAAIFEGKGYPWEVLPETTQLCVQSARQRILRR